MLQGERFILAPSFRGAVRHDGEGVTERLLWWQEREEAASVFWWIRKQRNGYLPQGPPAVCCLPTRLFQRCSSLPKQCQTHLLVCSHLIQTHPVLKTLQKSMSHMRKVVLMLPPHETFKYPLMFLSLCIYLDSSILR